VRWRRADERRHIDPPWRRCQPCRKLVIRTLKGNVHMAGKRKTGRPTKRKSPRTKKAAAPRKSSRKTVRKSTKVRRASALKRVESAVLNVAKEAVATAGTAISGVKRKISGKR